MNQVGDVKTFTVDGSPPPGSLAYVYKWWDATVTATGSNAASKQLNIGGNPADGFLLRFSCQICDQFGNSQTLPGSVGCNNPPTIIQSPVVAANNLPFSYHTQITVDAYDLEEAGAISFFWFAGTAFVGQGVTNIVATVAGTYAGTVVGVHNVYENVFQQTIAKGQDFTVLVVDADSGMTALDFRLDGFIASGPQFSVTATPDILTANATTLPTQEIGSVPIDFSIYASDTSAGSISFYWAFYGSNGWDSPDIPFFSTGTTAAVELGFRNDVVRSIANEHVSGLRTVEITVTNTTTGKSTQSEIDVNLLKNDAPAISAVNAYSAATGQPLPGSISKSGTPVIKFSGTASDPNADVIYYQWTMSQPVAPTNLVLYGRDVLLDISRYPIGQYDLGALICVDRLGAQSLPVEIPLLNVTA